jgi:hypothetical protein
VLDKVKSAFEALDFHCQRIGFDVAIPDKDLRRIIEQALPANDLAKVLRYFPSLFVLHAKLPPKVGAFFVCVFTGTIRLSVDELSCYRKYYPQKILILAPQGQKPRVLEGQWIWKCRWADGQVQGKLPRLGELLRRDLSLRPSGDQLKKIAELGFEI